MPGSRGEVQFHTRKKPEVKPAVEFFDRSFDAAKRSYDTAISSHYAAKYSQDAAKRFNDILRLPDFGIFPSPERLVT